VLKDFEPIAVTVNLYKLFVRSIVDNYVDDLRHTRPKVLRKVGIKVNDIIDQIMSDPKFLAAVNKKATAIATEALEEAVRDGVFEIDPDALSILYDAEAVVHAEQKRLAEEELAAEKIADRQHIDSAIKFLAMNGYAVTPITAK